jgi:hypothetical protein
MMPSSTKTMPPPSFRLMRRLMRMKTLAATSAAKDQRTDGVRENTPLRWSMPRDRNRSMFRRHFLATVSPNATIILRTYALTSWKIVSK